LKSQKIAAQPALPFSQGTRPLLIAQAAAHRSTALGRLQDLSQPSLRLVQPWLLLKAVGTLGAPVGSVVIVVPSRSNLVHNYRNARSALKEPLLLYQAVYNPIRTVARGVRYRERMKDVQHIHVSSDGGRGPCRVCRSVQNAPK
jgi:hypothetical protein